MALPLVDRSPQVLIVNVIFWILSWISILLRLYVRAGLLKWFGVDDWTMIITQVSGEGVNRATSFVCSKKKREEKK
jgi:hypothetical protein